MISWYNPIIVWMYLIYIAVSVIAGPIVIGYLIIKLIKKRKGNHEKRNEIIKRAGRKAP